jgi:hypothetical protein
MFAIDLHLQQLMCGLNRAACNALDRLIQPLYGEDGMHGAFIENQYIETFSMMDKQF